MTDFKSPNNSRRKQDRVHVSLPVKIQEAGSTQVEHLKTDNISTAGMFILSSTEHHPIGTKLNVCLDLDTANADASSQVICEARIVHYIHPKGFGIEISKMSPSDRQRYNNLFT